MIITITSGVAVAGVQYQPTDNTDWSELGSSPYGTWASWTTWHPTPNNIVLVIEVDAGSIDLRTPILQMTVKGEIESAQLKITSTTVTDSNGVPEGAFAGEETTYAISTTPVSYVAGRHYRWTVTVGQSSNDLIPLVLGINAGFSTETTTEIFREVNTATLSGTIDARVINTANIGVCRVLLVTAHQSGTTYSSGLLQDRVYAIPDDYVFQENAITANIVSKAPPTIRCFDLNGESIDALVDIYVEGLPKVQLQSNGVY